MTDTRPRADILDVMPERQLDLFSGGGASAAPKAGYVQADPVALDDNALIAAIPEANFGLAQALACEASRRGLIAAVPALESLCRRLKGFGLDQAVPEQVAALNALAEIRGVEAARAVTRILCQDSVQGPTLAVAVAAAARLGVVLPEEKAANLLRHADPAVRADACRCAPFRPAAVAVLGDLLHDLNAATAIAAACALGRMGQAEARPALLHQLRRAPTAEIMEAISEIACDETIVLLGRIASSDSVLARRAFEALEGIDNPRARRLAEILTVQGRSG